MKLLVHRIVAVIEKYGGEVYLGYARLAQKDGMYVVELRNDATDWEWSRLSYGTQWSLFESALAQWDGMVNEPVRRILYIDKQGWDDAYAD